jgi:hypothetical protein
MHNQQHTLWPSLPDLCQRAIVFVHLCSQLDEAVAREDYGEAQKLKQQSDVRATAMVLC